MAGFETPLLDGSTDDTLTVTARLRWRHLPGDGLRLEQLHLASDGRECWRAIPIVTEET